MTFDNFLEYSMMFKSVDNDNQVVSEYGDTFTSISLNIYVYIRVFFSVSAVNNALSKLLKLKVKPCHVLT